MIIQGDCLQVMRGMDENQFHCCVTSPPYWGLRDYGLPPSDWPEVTYTPMPGLPPVTVPAWTGCLGLEPTPEMFVAHIVLVFREVWRVLRDDATLWLNFGDTYAGSQKGRNADGRANPGGMHRQSGGQTSGSIDNRLFQRGKLKPKDLAGIPWRVAFALQADGWYLRMDNIWNKLNCMPESVRDRPTKAHEYLFLLSKKRRYYYDAKAIDEPAVGTNMIPPAGSAGAFGPKQARRRSGNKKRKYGDNRGRPGSHLGGSIPWAGEMRSKRSVFTVASSQGSGTHFATFPEKLVEPCILAGAPVGGRVLDPFGGSGTALKVALENGRECTIIEMNPDYVELAERRTATVQPKLQL